MSQLELVEKVLDRFLSDPKSGVLAIKGKWGVGKTYFWHRYVESRKSTLKQKAYSYVSLFGTGSISELRNAIFTKQVGLGSKANATINYALSRVGTLLKSVDLGPATMGTLKNTEIWSDLIQEKLLNNFVICIDDLERKERGITPSAFLGFITNLRDERNCKVILLYNESAITENKPLERALAEYREKVFDVELSFEPSVDEC
jgi:Cdc6-like AAA superfamily ATPase